jgi:DNA-binding GntR family transcriptional regulator
MSFLVRSLPDQLVELVRDRILTGHVTPSEPIRQDALAAELGVSKIPLREALTRLEQEGLVQRHANRGFFVSSLTADEAEEVFALRLKLEPDAAAKAAKRATQEERQAAISVHDTLLRATNAHGDGVGAFNRAFHLALIRPCRQGITVLFLERLHVLSERYVRKHLEPLGRDERANEEHQKLLDAWLERDTKQVTSQLHQHVKQTLEDLRRQLAAER